MRFETVTAVSFGPFRGEHLRLAPAFTIVTGPNESGKTTWAAALYSSLAGRRRSRGRGTRDDAQFKAKHKPWSGSRWQVTTTIRTDDGTRLNITHDLVGGTSRILPTGTSRLLSRSELEHRFGLSSTDWDDIDVAELFGLSRGTLRATTFVPQAEILRVLEQADELQQYLQRAASSQTVDVTAQEVLDTLNADLATRVGSLSIGRRPLRRATEELQDAEDMLYQLRAARDELRRTTIQVAELARDEAQARNALAQAQAWQKWADVDALEGRIGRIRSFDAELAADSGVGEPAPPELLKKVLDARIAFLTRGEPPEAPTGPSVDALQSQLAALPQAPEGDTSPDPRVRALWEQLNHATSAAASRAELAHENATDDELPYADSDELRRHANRLRLRRPTWDPLEDETETLLRNQHAQALERFVHDLSAWQARKAAHEQAATRYATARERYAAEQAEYARKWDAYRATLESRSESVGRRGLSSGAARFGAPQWLLMIGAALIVAGLAATLLDPLIGVLVAALGVVVVVASLLMRTGSRRASDDRAPSVPQMVTPPPAPQPPDPPDLPHLGDTPTEPALSDQVAAIALRRSDWGQRASLFDAAHDQLTEELTRLGLPTNPEDLDRLAQAIDLRAGARKLGEEQRADLNRLQGEVRGAAKRLLDALSEKGEQPPVAEGKEAVAADAAYRLYEAACSRRAEIATEASRRADLTRALEARSTADAAYRTAVERWASRGDELLATARLVGGDPGEDAQAAAQLIGDWLGAQDHAAAIRQKRDRISSLREQLLTGSTLHQLESHVATARAGLSVRPETLPPNTDELVAAASTKVEACVARRATAEGQLVRLREQEGDLPAAIELAAARRAEKDSLVELKATLELAIEHLEAAQQQAHRTITPVLESAIRRRLPLVTGGRYQDARVTPETLAVELQERSGVWRDAALLSQGTAEQTFLLLRLALVEHLGTDETMPLILDDVTVQCDATRTEALLSLLHDISKERQVILFSQETSVRDWAATHLDPARSDLMVSLPPLG